MKVLGLTARTTGFRECSQTPNTTQELTRASLGFLQPPQVVSSGERGDRARAVAQCSQGLEQLQVGHGGHQAMGV